MSRKQIKVKIFGKTRIVRDIRVDDKNEFEGYYQNCFIKVQIERDERKIGELRFPSGVLSSFTIYVWCIAPSGSRIVDGYVAVPRAGDELTTIIGVREALENILYEERPK